MAAAFKIPDVGAIPPWDVLPREPMGDPTKEAIYQAVGAALSEWEMLDSQQASLFGEIAGSRARGAEAAYGTVVASSGRTAMVHAAADRAFARSAPTLLADMRLFIDRVGKLSGRRNEIAHGIACGFMANEKDLGNYLIPAFYNTRKHMTDLQYGEAVSKISMEELLGNPFGFGPNKYAYTARQIAEYTKHFAIYKNAMIELVGVVRETCGVLFP